MRTLTLIVGVLALASAYAQGQVKIEPKVTVNGSVCDKLVWVDAAGKERTVSVVVDKDKEKFAGGYAVDITYYADGALRDCKAGGGGTGGFGHLVMHGGNPRGWATSKEDAKKIECLPLFEGANHAIYRARMDVLTSGGMVPCTVDYFVRTGRNDFIWAVTFDTSATTKLVADTRSPYIDFDWEGDGKINEPISGLGWAAGSKQFRTLDEKLTAGTKWDWTKDCNIPHIIEWKTKAMGDAEVGLVQTQTYAQHDAGSAGWNDAVGKSGTGLPAGNDVWKLSYQLNCYQGYGTKRATWMMPYGAVGSEKYDIFDGSRKASGKPFQSYSVLCLLDKYSDGGVDALVNEMAIVQEFCKCTATTGTVAAKGPAGAGRTDEAAYAPAGWDQVYAMWTAACADNAIDCNLAIEAGSLTNPTFCFTNYSSPKPPAISLNGAELKADKDYFASVDTAGKRLFVTFGKRFEGAKNAIAFKGLPNTTVPELSKVTITPASNIEGDATKVTVTVDVKDPDNNLAKVTIDLTALGGKADTELTGKGNGTYTCAFETAKDVAPGNKTLKIVALDADKNSAQAAAAFTVNAIPIAYGEGLLYDPSKDGAQGWVGHNSKLSVVSDKVFGDGKYALKIEGGQWGAIPIFAGDISHVKKVKVALWADLAPGKTVAWPFLVTGVSTDKAVGPEDKGGMSGGKWVEWTIDLPNGAKQIELQTYDAAVLYVGQVWVDGMVISKGKPESTTKPEAASKPAK
jgi:hypothetical protein